MSLYEGHKNIHKNMLLGNIYLVEKKNKAVKLMSSLQDI